jgi:hypothetical protein
VAHPALEQAHVAAIAVGDVELFEERGQAHVAGGEAQATGLVAPGTGEPGFRLAMAIPL